ncbi:hypothetical protein Q1695_012595 [Nippostrongylus brasiliensis]|nr:hypothetical protein Q1695_012595 [Nippostrongylus brasiliensis]
MPTRTHSEKRVWRVTKSTSVHELRLVPYSISIGLDEELSVYSSIRVVGSTLSLSHALVECNLEDECISKCEFRKPLFVSRYVVCIESAIERLWRTGKCISFSSLNHIGLVKYSFEKDIVMYARLNKLDYFYTECVYAPDSYRQYSRPESILALIHSGESMVIKSEVALPTLINCNRCGYISSQPLCKACLLLEGLNTGRTDLGVKKKAKKIAIVDDEKAQKGCGGESSCEDGTSNAF